MKNSDLIYFILLFLLNCNFVVEVNSEPISCYFCDSDSNPNCATLKDKTSLETLICSESTKCVIRIDNATTIRDCYIEGEECKASNCLQCTGENCNDSIFPIKRLSCHQCDNCLDEQNAQNAVPCQNYDPNESCYTNVVDEKTIYRGCLSDPVNYCREIDKFCVKCNDKSGCNSKNYKTAGTCITCDAAGDCVKNPTKEVECKDMLLLGRYPKCYTSYRDEKTVERGCFEDASSEFKTECNGNHKCNTCDGNNCNKVSIREIKCVTCNSTATKNCATLESPAVLTQNSKACAIGESCFIKIENGITFRGCTADLTENEMKGELYEQCYNEDSCNKYIFPSDRLQCHKCEGVRCVVKPTAAVFPCKNYDENDTCYTLMIEEKSGYRGCTSDDATSTGIPKCLNDPKMCLKCDENKCNGDNGVVTKDRTCLSCTDADESCSGKPSTQFNCTILLGRPFKCYTYAKDTTIVRGCIETAIEYVKEECEKDGSEICSICSEDNCNNQKVLKPDDYCYSCDSDQDENCKNNLSKIPVKGCYSEPDKNGCFHRIIGEHVTRGCLTDLEEAELSDCKDNKDECKTCEGTNCNAKTQFLQCFFCDSSSDTSCMLNGTNRQICRNYEDTCNIYVQENGKTKRGCLKETNPNDDKVVCTIRNCYTCNKNNCNGQTFPLNRLSCNQCNSVDNIECLTGMTSPSTFSSLCRNFNSNDYCYSLATVTSIGETHIYRGCLSDNTRFTTNCKRDGSYCKACSSPNCNIEEVSQNPTLRCIKCAEVDEKCSWGFDESQGELCEKTVLLGVTETCYVFSTEKRTHRRGCTLDDEIIGPTNRVYEYCDRHSCNRFNKITSSCIQCDSSKNGQEECAKIPKSIEATTCTSGNQLYNIRGCFTHNKGDYVIRGCVSSLKLEEKSLCGDDGDTGCGLCYTDGCNNKAPPKSGSAKLKIMSMGWLIGLNFFTKLLMTT